MVVQWTVQSGTGGGQKKGGTKKPRARAKGSGSQKVRKSHISSDSSDEDDGMISRRVNMLCCHCQGLHVHVMYNVY